MKIFTTKKPKITLDQIKEKSTIESFHSNNPYSELKSAIKNLNQEEKNELVEYIKKNILNKTKQEERLKALELINVNGVTSNPLISNPESLLSNPKQVLSSSNPESLLQNQNPISSSNPNIINLPRTENSLLTEEQKRVMLEEYLDSMKTSSKKYSCKTPIELKEGNNGSIFKQSIECFNNSQSKPFDELKGGSPLSKRKKLNKRKTKKSKRTKRTKRTRKWRS